ncbi:transmembrane protein, putative (macronuclear) [Tetrahymena thermophila SB210]|uniref:Transmembrane protein, putative n=1 Tax=Tetrahymena thermophila (strain SB210) TaxID=312017 RepID=Q23KF8_TETTS|nr:transmembrane protein, putative [Tetrahymena thermophila SB210]EAR96885.2 transmembrane protein, putative [Tetrahymena thermophila SB210]|eukprot:XP_001017130.2 transmembrane protein, putative [Tetrahymena thermophila SB210]
MAYTTFQTVLQLLSFAGFLALGIWNFISNILYYYSTNFNTNALQQTFMLFLFLSVLIQLIAWSNILLKVRFKYNQQRYQNELLNAQGNIQAWIIFAKIKFMLVLQIIWCLIINFPLILFITIFQKIKIFPMILFGYTYFKYKAVLTTDLMHSLEPIMNQYYKKKQQQLQSSQSKNLYTNQNHQEKKSEGEKFQQSKQDEILENENYLVENQLVQDIQDFQIQMSHKKKTSVSQKNQKNQALDQIQLGPIITLGENIDIENQLQNTFSNNQRNILQPNNSNLSKGNHQEKHDIKKSQCEGIDLKNDNKKLQQPLVSKELEQNISNLKNNNKLESFRESGDLINLQKIKIKKSESKIEENQQKNQQVSDNNKNDQKAMDTENSLYFGINLLIDANIVPNLQTLLFDRNLQKFQVISDIQEAIFESLPIAIIQYINNTQNNSWTQSDGKVNLLLYTFFASSCLSLLLHCISLISILYDNDIQTFTKVLDYLEESTTTPQQNIQEANKTQKNIKLCQQQTQKITKNQLENSNLQTLNQQRKNLNQKKTNFGDIFPMRQNVEIDTVEQLDKLVRLTEIASKNIKKLTVILPNNIFSKKQIQENLVQCFQKFINIQTLELNLEGNQMGDQLCKLIFRGIFQKLQQLKNLRLFLDGNQLTKEGIHLLKRMILSWEHREKGNISKVIISEEVLIFKKRDKKQNIHLDETNDISFKQNGKKSVSDKNNDEETIEDKEEQEEDEILLKCLNNIVKRKTHQAKIYFEIHKMSVVSDQELLMINNCLKNLQKLIHVELILVSDLQENIKDHHSIFSQINNSIRDTVQTCFFSVNGKILKSKGTNFQCQESQYGQQFIWENQGLPLSYNILRVIQQNDLLQINQNSSFKFNFDNQRLCKYAISNIIDTLHNQADYKSLILNFNRNKGNDNNVQYLTDSIKSIKLSQLGLQLANTVFSEKGFLNLSQLIKSQNQIEDFTLEISQNEMTNTSCQLLCQSIQSLSELKKLQLLLHENKILNEGQQIILEALTKSQCEIKDLTLDFSANTMNIETCNSLSKLLSYKESIEQLELILQFNNIKSEGLQKISQTLPSLQKLKSLSLDLKGNNLDSKGMDYLSQHLKEMFQLKELKLDLRQNEQIGDQGLENLSKAIEQLTMIQSIKLNLRKCSITHQGLIKFIDIIYNRKNITSFSLDIQENMLQETTENRLSAIRQLTKYISLQEGKLVNLELYLNNLELTEDCILCIAGMLDKLPQLQKLQIDLRGNKVEEKLKRYLFRSLASLKYENPLVIISI